MEGSSSAYGFGSDVGVRGPSGQAGAHKANVESSSSHRAPDAAALRRDVRRGSSAPRIH